MKNRNLGAFVAFATLTFVLTSMPIPSANAIPASASTGLATNFYDTDPELECNSSVETCCNETHKTGSNPLRSPATCGFVCGTGALLSIEVVSSDGAPFDVEVWGEAKCASKTAVCERSAKSCTGVSTELTTRQGDGECVGDSDDFWASETTIVCVATVPSLPCEFRETHPSMEEVLDCAMLLSCTVQPIDENGHYYGASLCQYEDDDGKKYQYLCVYKYANKNCHDLSNATMVPYFPGSENLAPEGALFDELASAFARNPPSKLTTRIVKLSDGVTSSEIMCSGFACIEYASK